MVTLRKGRMRVKSRWIKEVRDVLKNVLMEWINRRQDLVPRTDRKTMENEMRMSNIEDWTLGGRLIIEQIALNC